MMIFNLSDCEIDYEPDIDPDLVQTVNYLVTLLHLTKEKWVVLWAADAPEAINHDITDSHFQFSIATHVKLHDDKDMWMVPLSTLVGPCFVAYNKNYNGDMKDDRTGYVVKPMSEWAMNSFQCHPNKWIIHYCMNLILRLTYMNDLCR